MGVGNELILENALRIAAAGGKMQVRVPVIPRYNDSDENIHELGRFVRELGQAVAGVQVLPYHSMGVPKWERIRREGPVLEAALPSEERIEAVKSILEEYGLLVQVHRERGQGRAIGSALQGEERMMYEFSPITDRVARIRRRYRDTMPKVCIERFKLVTQFYMDNPTLPHDQAGQEPPEPLREDAGARQRRRAHRGRVDFVYRASALYPEYSVAWLFDEIRTGEFRTRTLDPYDMDQKDMDYVMQYEDFWAKNDLSTLTDAALPPEFGDIVGNGVVTFGERGSGAGPVGHFCTDYQKAIRKGFAALKEEALEKIAGMTGRLYGDDAEREQFYRAVTIVCDAIITLSKRYAGECRRQADECADAVRKAELLEMAECLDHIMVNPARTFFEAVQALYLYQIVLSLDGNLHGLTLGRVDQYLGDFYEADVAAGRLTRERAQEIIDLFCLKVAEMNKIWPKHATMASGGYTSGQLITRASPPTARTPPTRSATCSSSRPNALCCTIRLCRYGSTKVRRTSCGTWPLRPPGSAAASPPSRATR